MSQSDDPDAGLRGRSVLVVEDEFLIADDLDATLQECGARVLGPAATCAEALALLRRAGAVDHAILDINLGGELVFPVADALLAMGAPFVFATGYEEFDVPERFRAIARWEKPFDARTMVRSLFGARRRGRS